MEYFLALFDDNDAPVWFQPLKPIDNTIHIIYLIALEYFNEEFEYVDEATIKGLQCTITYTHSLDTIGAMDKTKNQIIIVGYKQFEDEPLIYDLLEKCFTVFNDKFLVICYIYLETDHVEIKYQT